MSIDVNTAGKTVLMRLPNIHTLDVRVEHRIARVTIDNSPINLMDATLLGELDQLAGWLATQHDSVRVVIFQSGIPDFFLAHLDLGLIQAIVDDPEPDVALESFQGLVARCSLLDHVTIAKVARRVGGGAASFYYQHCGIGRARRRCARAVIATTVGTFFFALVDAVPVAFLHYSTVWAVIDGVDIVAHDEARLWVFLRTRLCAPLMVLCGVVDGNTARWHVLAERTATPASVRMAIDAWAGNIRPPTKSGHPQQPYVDGC